PSRFGRVTLNQCRREASVAARRELPERFAGAVIERQSLDKFLNYATVDSPAASQLLQSLVRPWQPMGAHQRLNTLRHHLPGLLILKIRGDSRFVDLDAVEASLQCRQGDYHVRERGPHCA